MSYLFVAMKKIVEEDKKSYINESPGLELKARRLPTKKKPIAADTMNPPEGFDNHAVIANMYKNMNPTQRKQMLHVDLPNWGENAKMHFAVVAQNAGRYDLEPQHALDMWNAATGGVQFDNYDDQANFIDTVKRSRKTHWEPKGLKREF